MDFAMFALQSAWMPGRDAIDPSRALARDAEPLRQSLSRYFSRRIHDATEVEDLVQEVFTRIVARDSTQPILHLGGYVFQTAASVLADRARRRAVRQVVAHVSLQEDHHTDEDFDAERVLVGKQDLRAATAALLSLPARTRTIFVLHRLEGWKYRDIAVCLGISASAVEKHMVRAIQHLSASLGDRP
jgi:RNA polymerase sigma factor (sigma-70 family)